MSGLGYYLYSRKFAIMGAVVGALLFAIFVLRTEGTRNDVEVVQGEVKIIRETSPCTGLTTAECALKLLRALPEDQRREIRVTEKTLERLERRAQVQRRRVERGQVEQGADGRPISPPARSQGPTTERPGATTTTPSPSPAPAGPAGPSGASPTTPAPSSPAAPAPAPREPIIKTPTITLPQVAPPVPPVTVPSVEVPCIPILYVVNCP